MRFRRSQRIGILGFKMRFEDERYVRVYTRHTNTLKKIGWEGRSVWRNLLPELDRAGVFYCGGDDPVDAVATVLEMPDDIVRLGLERLIERRCIVHIPEKDCLFAPRFMEAQEAVQSNALKQKLKRDRAKARRALADLSADPKVASLIESDDEPSDTSGVVNSGSQKPQTTPEGSTPTPEGSTPTLCDNLKPSLPSRAEPNLGGGGAQPVPTLLREHPDEHFNSRDDIPLAYYRPSDWLIDDARAKGLTEDEITGTLDRYRKSSRQVIGRQGGHDKAFAAFLEMTLKNRGGPNGQTGRTATGRSTPPGRTSSKPPASRAAGGANGGTGNPPRPTSERDERARARAKRIFASAPSRRSSG